MQNFGFYFSLSSFQIVEKKGGKTKQRKPSKSSKRSWRVSAASAQQRGEDSKHMRHPFALYGSGEKDANMAGRKTHNVCPTASTQEVSFPARLLRDKSGVCNSGAYGCSSSSPSPC